MRAIAFALALLPAGAIAQTPSSTPTDTAAARRQEAALRRTARLFGDTTPLELTLTADFGRVFRNRDTLSTERFPATLTVSDTSGTPVTIALEIAPRGHFRLARQNCSFPPIKLTFADGSARGTPFQGQSGIKLGTHCRPTSDYVEYVLREHAVYRVHNLITDASLRSRLARITYRPERGSDAPYTTWGLLIEDEDDAARRNGGVIAELRRGRFADLDEEQVRTVGIFEYLIGNTDWSVFALHNIRLIQRSDGRIIPLAYDFDHSGIVSARYAKPDYRLPIKSVQERLYQGPCLTAEQLAPVFARFTAQRPAIEAVYAGMTGLDDDYRKWVRGYIGDFYATIGNARRVRERIIDACPRDGR